MNSPFGLVVLVVVLLAGAGCGSGERASTSSPPGARPAAPEGSPLHRSSPRGGSTIPAPAPTGVPADPASVAVIKAWSSALRRGDVQGAARFFALPSEMINGGGGGQVSALKLTSLHAAEVANEGLPCGAKLISADRRGQLINALFELTGRPGPGGSGCGSGSGGTARTNFVIRHGLIVLWIRAPDDPGDNGSGKQLPAPSTPPANGSAAPSV